MKYFLQLERRSLTVGTAFFSWLVIEVVYADWGGAVILIYRLGTDRNSGSGTLAAGPVRSLVHTLNFGVMMEHYVNGNISVRQEHLITRG